VKNSNMIIDNAIIIRCDGDSSVINGSVAISCGRIHDIGDSTELKNKYNSFEVIDASGKVLIPGFINSHTHLVLTVMRGTIEDIPGEVIYRYMGPITLAMTPEERSAMVKLGCLEAIRSGTTTVSDSSRYVGTYADTVVQSGMRVVLSELAVDAVNQDMAQGEYRYDRSWGQEYLNRTRDLIEKYHGAEDGRVECQVAAHAPDNCSPWMLRQLLDIAEKNGLRRNIHLAQSLMELEQVRRMSGHGSVEYLRENGWLDSSLIAAHWSHCSEEDIALLADHGVHMAHCPANSSRRGPHRAKVGVVEDAGINIAFGTDNMTEDMFRAMHFGIVVHRGSRGGGIVPSPQKILNCATRNGALALDRLKDIGTIEIGKMADLTIVDFNQPRLRPINNPVSSLVHYADPGAVHSVMVQGNFIMRAGKVLTMDEAEVMSNAEAAAAAAWNRLLASNPGLQDLRR
jgi:5-methylthioadenosine/S-adenosylhomocysteine deaminase